MNVRQKFYRMERISERRKMSAIEFVFLGFVAGVCFMLLLCLWASGVMRGFRKVLKKEREGGN